MAFLLSCLEKQYGEDILSMEVVEYVSQNMEVNYNVLNGVLQKLIARSKGSDKPINILSVKEIINNITMQMSEAGGNSDAYVPDTVVIARILKIVARYYELAPDDLIGDERKKAILVPRFVAMYLMYEIKQLSLLEICRKMNRNFENILYGVEKIKQEITKNSELRESIVHLQKQ